MDTMTYIIKVGDKFVGRDCLGPLEKAIHSNTYDEARSLLNLLRTIKAAAPSLTAASIWARDRESMYRVEILIKAS